MKKLIIALGLGLIITMFNIDKLEAQHISVNINLDYQPAWGPYGYEYAAYYYFPNLNIYYDVDHGLFIYPSGRRWVSSVYLPKKYRKYDLYMMYKVVINDIYDPWTYNNYHQRNYAHYRNNRSQVAIYYINDRHYHRAKQNHWAWVEPRYMPKQSHPNHKHLAHQHKPVQVNKNSHRSSASNNNRSTPNRSQSLVSGNNRNQIRNQQSGASSNRVEGRSSGTRNSESRSSVSNRSSSSSRNNNQTAANNNTKRTETRSSGTRSSQKESTTEKRNSTKDSDNKRSQKKTDSSRSGSSSRSGGRR